MYICLCIMIGITQKPEYKMYWTHQHIFATPIFSRLMRRDRFEQLRKRINFTDPTTEDKADSLWKLRFFFEFYISKFKENYTANEHIAIDENLSLWKGRLSFRIYIPTKRERYGVKIFMLCESETGYFLNFIIYTGATTEYPNEPADLHKSFEEYKSPSKVVFSLLHDYLGKGCCVTLDNYYTSLI